ncbi:predicted protein [Botrytis cinerea T4]|uniref:Uncharacterized protein n=1 Tax=Botryotinia fuckeliana (strain T4) TaxID=999810 RepID=G2YZA2_BOTF4|nr:predicted protein [Botrytis cinerea T4]
MSAIIHLLTYSQIYKYPTTQLSYSIPQSYLPHSILPLPSQSIPIPIPPRDLLPTLYSPQSTNISIY